MKILAVTEKKARMFYEKARLAVGPDQAELKKEITRALESLPPQKP